MMGIEEFLVFCIQDRLSEKNMRVTEGLGIELNGVLGEQGLGGLCMLD
jgi:hypothetical protein